MSNTWKPQNVWDGIGEGMVDISPMNQAIPVEVQQLVNAKRDEFIQGTAHPFDGPVKDQKGVVRVANGKVLEDRGQLAMDWYVEGVEGSIPQRKL
jgi:simple sugar transport system substrate-binding protein